jgi:hypothetical protein
MKMICDSHVHIGNYDRSCKILQTTKFGNKYKLYGSVDIEKIQKQDEYINGLKNFFAIPIIFKETNIAQENIYVSDYCSKHQNGIPVSIINNDFCIPKYNIWKEHFLLNDHNEIELRKKTYEYINDTGGFLIIHCKDRIRFEYIQKLHQLYNNINIIIAHLGRDCFENTEFVYNILKKYNDEKIFFDLSTITNPENIKNAFNMINNNNILFGSDYPYDSYDKIENLKEKIYLYAENPDDIFINNFKGVVKKLEKGK